MKLKRNPKRSIVGLSMGRVFNEVVVMNMGELEGEKFLVMTDLATHYCQGGWIKNKKPCEIISVFVGRWVRIFGEPLRILSMLLFLASMVWSSRMMK